jgi:hypothetical protein
MENNKYKIAIYSGYFGNYRKEVNENVGIDFINFDNDIDYYFFTDNENIKSDKWKVILEPLQPQLYFIDSYRHTSKYVKWILPTILENYDIIIWIDAKRLKQLNFTRENIIKIFDFYTDKNMFFIKHKERKTAQEELRETFKFNVEHRENGGVFLNKIKDLVFSTHMPETYCFLWKNTIENRIVLKDVYDELLLNGLRRDQNIIQYVLLKNNYEDKIDYFVI